MGEFDFETFQTLRLTNIVFYATNVVATSKHQGLPTISQCNAIKRIQRYLKGTKHLKLILGGLTGNGFLTAYTDVDYGYDHMHRNSKSGYVLYFNIGHVAWGLKKHACVATSTTHAKYIALYIVTKEVNWCRRLLADLGFAQTEPMVIYIDSQNALRLAMNLEFHAHTKHIDIKYHYTREQILLQSIRLQYVNTHDQIANILTKPLIQTGFVDFEIICLQMCILHPLKLEVGDFSNIKSLRLSEVGV